MTSSGAEEPRSGWFATADAERERETEPRQDEQPAEPEVEAGHEFDAERIVARGQGRDGWLREAKRQVEQDRWKEAGPVPRSRSERLVEAGNRLEEDLAAERPGERGS